MHQWCYLQRLTALQIHLITNCTNAKKSHLKNKVIFEDIFKSPDIETKDWLTALKNNPSRDLALNTYSGDHWHVAKSIHSMDIPLWILSAGFGFIEASEMICTYDATFSTGTKNSVSNMNNSLNPRDDNIQWWNSINTHKSNEPDPKPTLSSLIRSQKNDVFIVVASPSYLKVIEPELRNLAAEGIVHRGNTFIISSKVKLAEELMPLHYLSKEDFCEILKGPRSSLNVRLARYMLSDVNTQTNIRQLLRDKYNELDKQSKPAQKYKRKKLADNCIKDYIHSKLSQNKLTIFSATSLLKEFRLEGLACEHKRFGGLFKEVSNTLIKNTLPCNAHETSN